MPRPCLVKDICARCLTQRGVALGKRWEKAQPLLRSGASQLDWVTHGVYEFKWTVGILPHMLHKTPGVVAQVAEMVIRDNPAWALDANWSDMGWPVPNAKFKPALREVFEEGRSSHPSACSMPR